MAFREGDEIVLLLVPRAGAAPFRLPVPAAEYGAVRRLLQDRIRTHDLNMDGAILGLERLSPMKRKPPLQVWKFGGASLADAAAVRHAVGLIRAHKGPLVVVASALAGVTDLLLDGARRSVEGEAGRRPRWPPPS